MRKQVLLIAVFAILLAGCSHVPANDPAIEEEEFEKLNLTDEVAKYRTVTSKENFTLIDCKVIKDFELIRRCNAKFYLNDAVKNKDASLCNKIEFEDKKAFCLTEVQSF